MRSQLSTLQTSLSPVPNCAHVASLDYMLTATISTLKQTIKISTGYVYIRIYHKHALSHEDEMKRGKKKYERSSDRQTQTHTTHI